MAERTPSRLLILLLLEAANTRKRCVNRSAFEAARQW
jgi:hypothetical protein